MLTCMHSFKNYELTEKLLLKMIYNLPVSKHYTSMTPAGHNCENAMRT